MMPAKSKYESWLFRTMNNPELSWARPQSVRRKLVVAMLALVIGFAAAMWTVPSLWWFAPLIVVFVPLMGSLNGGIRGLTELRQHQLDEREGRARDAAFRKAFWPAIAVVFIGFTLLMQPNWSVEARAGLGFSVFILVLTMPTLILAWTLPDDVKDDL
jgi:diacylglycerol kinase